MNTRKAALHVLSAVLGEGAYANLALKSATSGLSAEDAGRIGALTYETLDHLYYLDFLIQFFAPRGAKPMIRNILRLGICELLFMRSPAHAVINAYVTLTKEVGKAPLAGFVNAVLRQVDRRREALPPLPEEADQRLSIQYSYPLWLVREWIARYGEDFTEALLSAPTGKTEVRPQYPCTVQTLLNELPVPGEVCRYDPNCIRLLRGCDVAALPAYQEGRMTIQGEAAMLVCRGLGDCKGLRVLDACAAPGGKSAYLASLWENTVDLTCLELHPHRKLLLDKTLQRLHVNAKVLEADAAKPIDGFLSAFDRVLVDAPCSGLGLLNDKPDIRYQKTDGDIDALAAVQKNLLEACAQYVRPGGILLYATCTISKRENEDRIGDFLGAHPDFLLDRLPIPLENDGTMQLFPHVHGTDGFFLGRMRRCI